MLSDKFALYCSNCSVIAATEGSFQIVVGGAARIHREYFLLNFGL